MDVGLENNSQLLENKSSPSNSFVKNDDDISFLKNMPRGINRFINNKSPKIINKINKIFVDNSNQAVQDQQENQENQENQDQPENQENQDQPENQENQDQQENQEKQDQQENQENQDQPENQDIYKIYFEKGYESYKNDERFKNFIDIQIPDEFIYSYKKNEFWKENDRANNGILNKCYENTEDIKDLLIQSKLIERGMKEMDYMNVKDEKLKKTKDCGLDILIQEFCKKHEDNRFFFEILTDEEKKILMLNFASEYAKQQFGENFMTILEIDQNIEDVHLLGNIYESVVIQLGQSQELRDMEANKIVNEKVLNQLYNQYPIHQKVHYERPLSDYEIKISNLDCFGLPPSEIVNYDEHFQREFIDYILQDI